MIRSNNFSNPKGSRSSSQVVKSPARVHGAAISIFAVLTLACAFSFPASAEIYHYIDDRGRKVYVDRESRIPPEYREKVEARADSGAMNVRPEPTSRERQLNDLRKSIDSSLQSVERAIAESETPVKIIGNGVILPVRAVYGGRRADTQMLLDTGASGTVFHRDALERLNGATYRSGQARVASGDFIDVDAINLDRIEIGPFTIKSIRAMVIDPVSRANHDGLLGMDFLRQVHYRIDYDRNVIIWEPDRYAQLKKQRETLRSQQQMEVDELIESLTSKEANPS